MNSSRWVLLIALGFAVTPLAAQTHHAHHAHSGTTAIPTGIVFTAPVANTLGYGGYGNYGGYGGTVAYPPLNYNTLSWPLSNAGGSYLPNYNYGLPYFSTMGVGLYPSLLQSYPYQSQYTSPSLILRAAPGNMPGGTFMLPPLSNASSARAQTISDTPNSDNTKTTKDEPPPVLMQSQGLRITIITPGSSSNPPTPTPLPSYTSR